MIMPGTPSVYPAFFLVSPPMAAREYAPPHPAPGKSLLLINRRILPPHPARENEVGVHRSTDREDVGARREVLAEAEAAGGQVEIQETHIAEPVGRAEAKHLEDRLLGAPAEGRAERIVRGRVGDELLLVGAEEAVAEAEHTRCGALDVDTHSRCAGADGGSIAAGVREADMHVGRVRQVGVTLGAVGDGRLPSAHHRLQQRAHGEPFSASAIGTDAIEEGSVRLASLQSAEQLRPRLLDAPNAPLAVRLCVYFD